MSKPGTTFNVGYNINLHESCAFGPGADAIIQDFDQDQAEVREDGSVIIRYRFTTFEFDEPVSDLDEAFDRIQAAWRTAPNSPVQLEIFQVERAETNEKIMLELRKHGIEAGRFSKEWTDAEEQRLRELEELQALHQWDTSTLYNHDLLYGEDAADADQTREHYDWHAK